MVTVALHGAGHMGAGLGWDLRQGGVEVITTVAGRSARTARLAAEAGLVMLAGLDDVVRVAELILVVTPPAAARAAAAELRAAAGRTGAAPLIADLNAVAPSTVDELVRLLSPLDLVDGSISGAPPTVRPGARLYLSGARAAEVAELPWRLVRPVLLPGGAGRASALKMCTASVYKGTTALYSQALRTAYAHGLLDEVVADLAGAGHGDAAASVALAASKAARYVPEMREIAATQAAAGLTPDLFEALAAVFAELATTPLAAAEPDSVDLDRSPAEIIARAAPG
jgi:3-hydroxyisobutyrate dehydrogenase-like beta-hydroxyacid dehydrogenase